jgi:TusA-related sulfurtransferase
MKPPTVAPDFHLDLMGETCPYVAVTTLEALQGLRPRQVLEVMTDCSQSIHNVPADARNHGHEMIDVVQDGPVIRYIIRRGQDV